MLMPYRRPKSIVTKKRHHLIFHNEPNNNSGDLNCRCSIDPSQVEESNSRFKFINASHIASQEVISNPKYKADIIRLSYTNPSQRLKRIQQAAPG